MKKMAHTSRVKGKNGVDGLWAPDSRPVRSLEREKKNRIKEENNRNRTRRGTCGRKKRTKISGRNKTQATYEKHSECCRIEKQPVAR
jgi:hypothetical protein